MIGRWPTQIILLLISSLLLSGCWDFNNPADPGAENYQGFRSERDDGPVPTFSVVYDANGASAGTVPVDSVLHASGDSVAILGNSGGLTRGTDLFVGWNTADDGSGTQYNPRNRLSMPAADVRLYANWVPFGTTTYTVNYNGNGQTGGTPPTDLNLYLPGTEVTIQWGNDLYRNGYRINNWDTLPGGGGIDYGLGTTSTITANLDLYLDWDPDFAGGDGTIGTPFQVATVNHLYNMRYIADLPDIHFILINDIDLGTAATDLTVATYDPGLGWEPIGVNLNAFDGNFGGGGYSIRNLYINRGGNDIGLFGVTQGAQIYDLHLDNVDVSGGGQNIGGLIGRIDSIGTDFIGNCSVSGTVAGGDQTGGLVGRISNNGEVFLCLSTADVSGGSQIGGLVGYNGDTITNSSFSGTVSGTSIVGGLAGENDGIITGSDASGTVNGGDSVGGLVGDDSGTVDDCYAISTVSSTTQRSGGLVGQKFGGTIQNSYATGAVNGLDYVGGLIGVMWNGTVAQSFADVDVSANQYAGGFIGAIDAGVIDNNYAYGDVTGNDFVGGFSGQVFGVCSLNNSYANGMVSTAGPSQGGFIGEDLGLGTITGCYYNMDSSGMSDTGKGEPLSDGDLRNSSIMVGYGWDFTAVWDNALDTTHPYLQWQPGGVGAAP